MTAKVKLTPWQWVKAAGPMAFTTVWCGYFLVRSLVVDESGWWRALFVSIFGLLLALNLWQWPRTLRNYRAMVASRRRLGESRARFLAAALARGYPPEIVLRVDEMIMAEAPAADVKALLDEHRPPRRLFGFN